MARRDLKLLILKEMLATPNHLSMRQISRDLDEPSSVIYDHMQRMVKMGLLVKHEWDESRGDVDLHYAEYEPNPIFGISASFTEDLYVLMEKVHGTPETTGKLVEYMLKLKC